MKRLTEYKETVDILYMFYIVQVDQQLCVTLHMIPVAGHKIHLITLIGQETGGQQVQLEQDQDLTTQQEVSKMSLI